MKNVDSNIGNERFSKILGNPLKCCLMIIPALIIMLSSSCFAVLMDINCENYCENIELDPAIDPDTIAVCYPNSCSYPGYGCLPPSYPCDFGYECCDYYCSGGVNGFCFVDGDCPGEQVCCNYNCQQSCGSGGDLGAGICAAIT